MYAWSYIQIKIYLQKINTNIRTAENQKDLAKECCISRKNTAFTPTYQYARLNQWARANNKKQTTE
jgi:hypothetical protein